MSGMEYSCGAVLYAWSAGQPEYVLVYDSHYGFPKGHVEPDETKEQTALREIYEETGIRTELDTSFCEITEYDLPKKPGIRKQVTFFLASYDPLTIHPRAENEIRMIRLARYEDAMKLLWHPNLKTVLKKAHAHILKQRADRS